MHSSVFLDENYQVIRRAILWNDTRTSAQCRYIEETVDPHVLMSEVCNPVLEGFTLPKVLWLRDNEPENFRRLRHLVLPKDYVRFRLTGQLHMELSDAAGMLMMNVREKIWSRPLDALDLSLDILPPLVGSSEIVGTITQEVAELTGLKAGIPVVGGGADNACGAVGSGVVRAGRGMVSLGSSGVVLAHLQQPKLVTEGTVHMFNSCVPNEFYMMGVMLAAGLSLSWLRNQLGREEYSYDRMTELASAVKPGSRGLIFLPYLTGERTPHGDANARGCFVGLSSTRQAGDDPCRFGRCSLRPMRFRGTAPLGRLERHVARLDGGAGSPLWKEDYCQCHRSGAGRDQYRRRAGSWCCYSGRRWCGPVWRCGGSFRLHHQGGGPKWSLIPSGKLYRICTRCSRSSILPSRTLSKTWPSLPKGTAVDPFGKRVFPGGSSTNGH